MNKNFIVDVWPRDREVQDAKDAGLFRSIEINENISENLISDIIKGVCDAGGISPLKYEIREIEKFHYLLRLSENSKASTGCKNVVIRAIDLQTATARAANIANMNDDNFDIITITAGFPNVIDIQQIDDEQLHFIASLKIADYIERY